MAVEKQENSPNRMLFWIEGASYGAGLILAAVCIARSNQIKKELAEGVRLDYPSNPSVSELNGARRRIDWFMGLVESFAQRGLANKIPELEDPKALQRDYGILIQGENMRLFRSARRWWVTSVGMILLPFAIEFGRTLAPTVSTFINERLLQNR